MGSGGEEQTRNERKSTLIISQALVLKRKNSMPPLKHGKEDFIQKRDHSNRYNDHCGGILPQGREIGLNFEYSIGKRTFLSKEQCKGDSG